MTQAAACTWCNSSYMPRTTGGHAQRFCRPACRRGFDAAGRRWVAEAIARGMLTIDALRDGAVTTRALLQGAISPAPISLPSLRHPPLQSLWSAPTMSSTCSMIS
jgi:hypothetical protein